MNNKKKLKLNIHLNSLINFLFFVPLIFLLTNSKINFLKEQNIGDINRYLYFLESPDYLESSAFELGFQIIKEFLINLNISPEYFFGLIISLNIFYFFVLINKNQIQHVTNSLIGFLIVFYFLPANFQAYSNLLSTWRSSYGVLSFLLAVLLLYPYLDLKNPWKLIFKDYNLNLFFASIFLFISTISHSSTLLLSIFFLIFLFSPDILKKIYTYPFLINFSIGQLKFTKKLLFILIIIFAIILINLNNNYFLNRIGHYSGSNKISIIKSFSSFFILYISLSIPRLLKIKFINPLHLIFFAAIILSLPLIFISPDASYRFYISIYTYPFLFYISYFSNKIFYYLKNKKYL